jgi:linoleoyl-CoA desaturase
MSATQTHPTDKLNQAATRAPEDLRRRPRFARNDGFQDDVRRRVEDYFRHSGRRQRDVPAMYLKTAIILALLAASYMLLVFAAQTWWQAVPLAILLGLVLAAVGFNVQHDGNHHGYSDRPWINKLMALTLDLMGGSSYLWHWKHNVIHHTYVNITGHDNDIDLGYLGRLTPHQRRLPWHRFQHWYLWPLYGVMSIKWQLLDDFQTLITGHKGKDRVPRPKRWDLVDFILGKVVFFTLAFGVPLLLHPWWAVLLFYGITSCVLGITLSIVFQMAHCVEEAEFPLPQPETGRIEKSWAVHQVETTVDFARRSRVVSWLVGGLNFQIEHHLFPRICHVNYPAISRIVEETCREYGVKYSVHSSFWAGLAAHYRWLRRLGAAPAEDRAALR